MSEIEEEGTKEEVVIEEREEVPSEEEEAPLYDVSRPELIDLMLRVVEIYEKALAGQISGNEVAALKREVDSELKKMLIEGVVVKKKAKVARGAKEKGERKGKRK